MIASGTIIIDGQTYHKGDVIHDLGGWDCIDTDGSKRYYWGSLLRWTNYLIMLQVVQRRYV